MSSFKYPDLAERQKLAADAKAAMLKKFREAAQNPAGAKNREARSALNDARVVRTAERDEAKKVQKAQAAKQAVRDAELAAATKRETEKADALRAAESAKEKAAEDAKRKVARDVRYAARKKGKK